MSLDDGTACTSDSCDPATGLVSHAPVAVDDGDACTTDACDPATGAISHTKMAGCGSPWTPTSSVGAPIARRDHSAVWTGSKMIVWGGYGLAGYEQTGGLYDPATDSWAPMSAVNAPVGRTDAATGILLDFLCHHQGAADARVTPAVVA